MQLMKKGTGFIIAGLCLIAAAIALTGYHLWDNQRAGQAAQAALEQLVTRIEADPVPAPEAGQTAQEIEYPDYVLDPEMDMPAETIDGSAYIGILSIPAISCELPVLGQWSYANLRNGPCRYSGSAYLDDLVICAHNYWIHFGSLKYLRYGDSVTLTDTDGNAFRYQVMEIETLPPTAVEEMTDSEYDLTLFTCTVGGAARVAVRCERAQDEGVQYERTTA